ncbi:MAG: hypothetical protein NTV61_08995 [Candidatus Bathyarchaeota archaeon]|nr:hypothetical protein [Candidatus Bathyarchaeota archaeon]
MYLERRQLTHEDVQRLVMGSVELIREAQLQLSLPLCPNIVKTKEWLVNGEFYADSLINIRGRQYGMDFGCFNPPNTIMLDKNLPFSDRPLDIPDLASTLTLYTAVHEVLHADDWVGGDLLHRATKDHMLHAHVDKLEQALEFIRSGEGTDLIKSIADLAALNASHYVDMVTHFRSFLVLRYAGAQRLDMIWDKMALNFFPPNLLTMIEAEKGSRYVCDLFQKKAGGYCLIDAFEEYESIGKRSASTYTV